MSVLQRAGYHTGLIGKWHLGTLPQFHPTRNGFNHFMGFLGGGNSPLNPTLEVAAPSSPSPSPSPSPTPASLPTRTVTSTPIPLEQSGPSSGGGPSAVMIGLIAFSVLTLSSAGAAYYWYRTRLARAAPAAER